MSRFVNGLPVRLDATLLWPLAVAGIGGVLLSLVHLQPVHYLLVLNVLIGSSLFANKVIRNVRLGKLIRRSLLIMLCLVLVGSIILPAKAAVITEYSMFGDPRPRGIAVDPGGTPWFTEQLGSSIGYLSGSTITELRIPTAGSEPWDIVYLPQVSSGTTDPNADSIWFTESAKGMIGRYKGGVFVEFDLTRGPVEGAYPSEYQTGITFDYNASSSVPYRNVWFVETGGDAIGSIYYNATGDWKERWVVTEFSVPDTLKKPIDIARNPVNGLMFLLSIDSLNIGSFNPWTRQFKVYDFKSQVSASAGSDLIQAIATGSDGIIWGTLDYGDTSRYDKIVRLDPWSGQITTYEIPTQGSGPRGITVDNDKNVWFTEYDKDKIGRLNPITGYITEYALPTSGSRPLSITTRDNIVWFTEWQGDRIGRLDPGSALIYSTVNTITSATSASGTATLSTTQPIQTKGYAIFSTSTAHTVNPGLVTPTVIFYTTGTAYGATTMTVYNRFATSSQTANTETAYVLPTSTTASTTSIISSTSWTTMTVSPTLTSVVQTDISSTTTTTSATYSTPVATETSYTTRQDVYTNLVGTTTQTIFAATSFRFTTITMPTYTQYSTSTILRTTTQTVSTVTTTATVVSTSTIMTTVTAGMMGPAILLLASFVILNILRRRSLRGRGENR